MTRTYQKGRYSRGSHVRGFKRISRKYSCHCTCCWHPRKKGWKKTLERNQVKSIMEEYKI